MKRYYRVYKAKKDLMWKGQVVYEKGEEIHDPFISRAKFYTVDAQDDDYLLSTKQCKKLNRLGSIPIKLDDIELISQEPILE